MIYILKELNNKQSQRNRCDKGHMWPAQLRIVMLCPSLGELEETFLEFVCRSSPFVPHMCKKPAKFHEDPFQDSDRNLLVVWKRINSFVISYF